VLTALVVLPASTPLTDLPPGADPCIALTPAVVDQLRTSGALSPLVPDEIATATLITAGRSLTGCPPTGDPDPAAIRAHVCPLLTAEGVEILADRFRATATVRADVTPQRIATAREALRCNSPTAADSEAESAGQSPTAVATGAGGVSGTVNRADREVPRRLFVTAITIAVAALIGVSLLLITTRLRRRSGGGGGPSSRVQVLHPLREATETGRQRIPDAADAEDHQQSTRAAASDLIGRPENISDPYDELLAELHREVTELKRTDERSPERATRPDDQGEH
jgi:hypothetical protein